MHITYNNGFARQARETDSSPLTQNDLRDEGGRWTGERTAQQDDLISSVIKSTKTILNSETLMIESIQDLVKDEVKNIMKEKLDANPELRAELKKAVQELLEAKVHEAYAALKIGKCAAKLGIEMVPPKLRKEIGQELVSMFEKEVNRMLEQS